jgi:hypothetical protein
MQKIFTVVHASDRMQVIRNVERSFAAGADGSFLINHAGIGVTELLETMSYLKGEFIREFKPFYFGVNLLGVQELETFKLAQQYGADGLWIDESYIRENSEFDEMLSNMDEARKAFSGEYFASVAFKTQGFCPDPAAVAYKAITHCDIVTTSGIDTGKAPEVEKIASMKKAIGEKRLAIASGISPENIHLFPMADVILVATGVQDSWTELSLIRICEIVQKKAR